MSLIERYRELYEHEIDCNQKMLAMLETVPGDRRSDPRFQRALVLADHLAAGREKWLEYMTGKGSNPIPWWNEQAQLSALKPRFAALEQKWTEYLGHLEESQLADKFELIESNGERFHIPIAVQLEQLVGHAAYHRGQIALLVDQLGGETVDTDYADWLWAKYFQE